LNIFFISRIEIYNFLELLRNQIIPVVTEINEAASSLMKFLRRIIYNHIFFKKNIKFFEEF